VDKLKKKKHFNYGSTLEKDGREEEGEKKRSGSGGGCSRNE
jgi:hypothetical protein